MIFIYLIYCMLFINHWFLHVFSFFFTHIQFSWVAAPELRGYRLNGWFDRGSVFFSRK